MTETDPGQIMVMSPVRIQTHHATMEEQRNRFSSKVSTIIPAADAVAFAGRRC